MSTAVNVLLVLSDQHQATCMGVEGHPQALTPNMDRLAGAGVRFANAYTQNPICTPSRVSILSGQYPHNHGCFGLSEDGPHRPMGLIHEPPTALPSFLGHFRTNGYRTAAIGKNHTPGEPVNWLHPHTDVFEEIFPYGGNQPRYYQELEKKGILHLEDLVVEGLPQSGWDGCPSRLGFDDSYEGWITREAIEFMDTGDGAEPFCIQVSYPRPHQMTGHAFMASPEFWEMYPADLDPPDSILRDPSGRPPHFEALARHFQASRGYFEPQTYEAACGRIWRAYLASITQVDHGLGLLLDYLDESGRARDTIVIYSSDHGGYSTVYGIPEKAPGIASRRVCRVPQLWRVPGVTEPGRVVGARVESVDIAATVPGLAGLEPMGTVDGLDLADLLRAGDEQIRDVAVTENALSKAMQWDRWWFVHYPRRLFAGQDYGELYDLDVDADETTNLYADPSHAGVVAEARLRLLDWMVETTRVTSAIACDIPETALARDLGGPEYLRPYR